MPPLHWKVIGKEAGEEVGIATSAANAKANEAGRRMEGPGVRLAKARWARLHAPDSEREGGGAYTPHLSPGWHSTASSILAALSA